MYTLAIVLTGMGQDELRGCEDIHEVGGQVVGQDEATSVVWGLPGYDSVPTSGHQATRVVIKSSDLDA